MTRPLSLVLVSALACVGGAAEEAGQAAAPREKMSNTPGMRLVYEEKSRGMDQGLGLEVVHYTLKTDGFPRAQRYALYGQWMDGRSTEMGRGMGIDEAGYVRGPDGDEFTLTVGRMFPGEYAVFALVSEDAASKAFVEITPFPIQAAGKGGCSLLVRPMEVRGQAFIITGSGFKPNKKLKTVSTSVNEVAYGTSDGRPDGTVKQVIFPAVVGRTGGDASFEASDSDCTVKVRYKWGDEMRGRSAAAPQPTP
jgi:hypothetical protein